MHCWHADGVGINPTQTAGEGGKVLFMAGAVGSCIIGQQMLLWSFYLASMSASSLALGTGSVEVQGTGGVPGYGIQRSAQL